MSSHPVQDAHRGGSSRVLRGTAAAVALVLLAISGSQATAPTPAGGLFFTITPCRLLDTRTTTRLVNGFPLTVQATGQCGIPAGASGLSFVPAAVAPSGDGFFQFYTGSTPPVTSAINFKAGHNRASNAIVDLDSSGAFTARPIVSGTGGSVDLVLDVYGYFYVPPTATDDTYSTAKNTPLVVPAPGVLGNDAGNQLSAQVFSGATTHGTVSLAADGSFTYTPASGYSGPDSFPYTVQNPAGSANATVNVSVQEPAAITSANATTFQVGTAGTFTVTVTGYPTPAITLMSGTLPSGVLLVDNGNGTATLAGTPAAGTGGVYHPVFDASNGVGPDATQNFTLTVNEAPAITSANQTTFPIAVAGTFSVTTTGFPAPALGETGALPSGVTFTDNGNGTATLAGTPAAGTSGDYAITITATNGVLPNAQQSFTLHVSCAAITVTPATLPGGTTGVGYSQSVGAIGGTGPYAFTVTAGAIPSGLALNPATGQLSGTPTAAATFNFTVTATDVNGCTGLTSYSVTIACPVIFVSPATLPGGVVGTPYSQPVSGSGGSAPYSYAVTAGSLPPNLSIDPSSGVISGSPTAVGTFGFTVTATDLYGCSGSTAYSVQICPAITLSPSVLPDATINVPYPTQTVTPSGGTAPYTFSVSAGTLPSGLALDASTGDITGTADTLGTSTFTIRATEADGCFGELQYTVRTCVAQNLTPSPGQLADAALNAPYGSSVTATGGAGPYSYAITSGTLPHNLSIDPSTGAITGTPDQLGNSSFTVTATDAPTGCTIGGGYSIRVCAPISLTATLPGGTVGAGYSQSVTASGGVGPYTYTVTSGTLPANLSLDSSTGAITGTPTLAGLFGFTITATDANGCTGSQAYSVRICPVITISAIPSVCAAVGAGFNQTVTASGGTGPYTYAVTSGALPTNLNLNGSTGAITGTPSAAGDFSFTITATDADGCTGSQGYAISVLGLAPAGPALPDATFGTPYTQAFTVTGGSGSFNFAITSGSVPSGLAISGNQLTGTPSGATGTGAFSFAVTATDASNGCTVTRNYSVTSRPVAFGDAYADGVGNTEYDAGGFAPPSTPAVSSPTNILTNDLGPGLAAVIVAQPVNGTVTLNPDGSFRYAPVAGANGSATFTYNVVSNGVTSASPASVTITLNGRVWYVNGGVSNGTGTSYSPFNNMNDADTSSTVNDYVFVHTSGGVTPGAITLETGQTLWGQGAAFSLAGLTIAAGTKPTLGDTVTIGGDGVTVSSLDVSAGSAAGITNPAPVTGLTIENGVSVSTTTGTAVSLADAESTSGISFRSVSSDGAANGISLTNVTGTFTITGNSSGLCGGQVTVNPVGTPATVTAPVTSDCTGGTIQNSTGSGISMTNVQSVSLTRVRVRNSGADGIRVNGATDLTLDHSLVTDNTGLTADDGIRLSNLSGVVTISNSTVIGGPFHNVFVDNLDTNMTAFNVTGSVVRDNTGVPTDGPAGDGLLLTMRGASTLTSGQISGSVFSGLAAAGARILTGDTAQIGSASGGAITAPAAGNSFTIQTSTFAGNDVAVDVSQFQQSNLAFQVLNNTINTTHGHAIQTTTAAGSDTGPASHFHVGKIDGNAIGTNNVKDSGSAVGSAIRALIQGQNTQGSLLVSNNTVSEVVNADILSLAGETGTTTAGTGAAKFKVVGNALPQPHGTNQDIGCGFHVPCGGAGIFILADQGFPVCTVVTGNTVYNVSMTNGPADIYLAERAAAPGGAQLTLEGSGSVTTFINANNTLAGPSKSINEGGNASTVPAGTCLTFPQ